MINNLDPQARATLILGGARSGKSRIAEALAETASYPIYLATAEVRDSEMAERIAYHRARRSSRWHVLEVPLDLPETLNRVAVPEAVLLVDCLTLWLANCLEAGHDLEKACNHLAHVLEDLPGRVVFVSNEVGLGLVPTSSLGRQFRDHAGWLHQTLAEKCEQVAFVVAGLPCRLKP